MGDGSEVVGPIVGFPVASLSGACPPLPSSALLGFPVASLSGGALPLVPGGVSWCIGDLWSTGSILLYQSISILALGYQSISIFIFGSICFYIRVSVYCFYIRVSEYQGISTRSSYQHLSIFNQCVISALAHAKRLGSKNNSMLSGRLNTHSV